MSSHISKINEVKVMNDTVVLLHEVERDLKEKLE